MEIILKQDVNHVGYKDEIVTVKDGYANNYLLPQGLAIIATPSAKKVLAENIRQRARKEEKLREESAAFAEKINAIEGLKITTKAGENGKIYGSVNSIQLADAIKAQFDIEIDRKKIFIKGEAIKEVGKYNATVNVYKDIKAEFAFDVIAE
ncbi:MAG: 50S ribosomal protein L9 [Synergistales bacterium]|jgi:large subunit ribosomal protein L9|nr:50S ribosomal protein L9 [Bacteroidales bacterium]MDY6434650.1 50S ribosomal protein L9 [Synergistales bacterium]MBQ6754596.1 50S ribosomal protein L9 [Bacteroidales bacterium]MDY6380662.1 50S ribosomal protein L9 [Bacteroidales bacterium]MDY6394034.1 50S ribosomal protein L9 [Bacteroidales bacterium]